MSNDMPGSKPNIDIDKSKAYNNGDRIYAGAQSRRGYYLPYTH